MVNCFRHTTAYSAGSDCELIGCSLMANTQKADIGTFSAASFCLMSEPFASSSCTLLMVAEAAGFVAATPLLATGWLTPAVEAAGPGVSKRDRLRGRSPAVPFSAGRLPCSSAIWRQAWARTLPFNIRSSVSDQAGAQTWAKQSPYFAEAAISHGPYHVSQSHSALRKPAGRSNTTSPRPIAG